MLHAIEISVSMLLEGLLSTIEISILAIVSAVILGAILAIGDMRGNIIIRSIVKAYIKVFRCTPFMVQIYIIFYGLPAIGIKLPAFWTGAIVLGMYTAAYLAIIFVSGIRSLPKGQEEAAIALGMPYYTRLRRILFPQTLSIIMPPITGQILQTVKDSSILSVITVQELTMMTKKAIGVTFSPFEVYLCAAVFYWILNLIIEYAGRRIENKSYLRRTVS